MLYKKTQFKKNYVRTYMYSLIDLKITKAI